jgi:hypothetical protein
VLYVATDSSRAYQWNGSVYVEVGVSGGGSSAAADDDQPILASQIFG